MPGPFFYRLPPEVTSAPRGLIHHAGSMLRRHLSPLPGACVILRLPLSATGRGWAHSPSSWQRAAPGRRAEWLEIREARWQPFPVKRQQWRGAGDRPSGSRCDGARPGNGQRAPEAKVVPRDTNRRTRVPKGNPGTVRSQGALQQGSQGDLPESPGASSPPGCRVGTRVPVAPPALLPGTDGAWANRPNHSSTVRATKSDMTTRINHPEVLNRVGLLVVEPSSEAGLPFI